jgi:hypothetical protein
MQLRSSLPIPVRCVLGAGPFVLVANSSQVIPPGSAAPRSIVRPYLGAPLRGLDLAACDSGFTSALTFLTPEHRNDSKLFVYLIGER